MSLYKAAQLLTAKGFYVFPLIENSKLPAQKDFTGIATDDAAELKKFWYDEVLGFEHYYNIGIATSKFRGGLALLVVDVDNKKGKNGSDTLLKLELEGYEFPKTLTQKTPTGGLHLIYKVKTPVKQGESVLGPGLDIRSRGGYILGAGSLLDGKKYLINSQPMADAPKWIIEKCKQSVKREKRKKTAVKKVSQKGAISRGRDYLLGSAPVAIEGSHGDATTFQIAARLKDIGVSEENCLDLMLDNWNENCQPPWNPDELKLKIENAYTYGQNQIGADSPESDFTVIKSDDYKDPVAELNNEFAFIIIGGKSTILKKTARGEVDYLTVSAFHDLLKASTIQIGNGRKKQLSELWFASHKRATYERLELLPEKEPPSGVFNLWRGFNCQPLELNEKPTPEMIEGVRLFKEHALENVCLGNQELFSWLFGYFAHLVQRPWEKPLTSIVFKGKKGVGKNALIDRIGKLFGFHYLLTSNRRYLISNFNKHMANLVLLVLDEAFWSGDKAAEGILKDLITGDSHLIEQKGREMYRAKNILRVCIIGNEDWVVPASEDERRFAVFKIGDKRQKDKKFFTAMKLLLDEKGGNRLLLRDLLEFNLNAIDIDDAPNTIGLLEQKIESLNPIHAWWLGCLKEGSILNLEFSESDWPKSIGRDAVRSAFLTYAKQRGIRSWLPDAATFGRYFSSALPGVQSTRLRDGRTRARMYVLPTLSEAREQFNHFIGHQLEWEEMEPSNVIDATELFS